MTVWGAERAPQDEYSRSAEVAMGFTTFFFPFISLIVALQLRRGKRSERKRAQLRTWAWISAAWLALQVVSFIFVF